MGPSPNNKKLDVAIIGGGMGGLSLAVALLKHHHLNVQVYEAAHKFSEIGAGVAFGPNAQRALALISPEAEQAFLKIVTHNMSDEQSHTWAEYRYGMGPKEGELIAAPRNESGQSTLHRAKFLDEFVKLIPEEIAHFGKRLDGIEEQEDGHVKLHFADDTSVIADCVIGCDGVHSVVRPHILGKDHSASHPVFSGSVAYRGLISMDEAVAAIGDHFAHNTFMWSGQGGCIMHFPIDHHKIMNVVVFSGAYTHWDGDWVQKADCGRIERDFKDWGAHAQKVIKLLDRPETMTWSLWDLPPVPTYCLGNIAMLGDAAHATTPFQGQGAGQAIEDAFVIGSIFANVDEPSKIAHAFRAYDKVRRPRSQKVVSTSREMGDLLALRVPSITSDTKMFKENIDWRMDWMWNRDIDGERRQAQIMFDKLVAGKKIDAFD